MAQNEVFPTVPTHLHPFLNHFGVADALEHRIGAKAPGKFPDAPDARTTIG
jgi:hypothetical protein